MPSFPSDRLAWACELVTLLDALPSQPRIALRLLYFDCLTESEVASRMGVDLSTARTAAAAGLRSLGEAYTTLRLLEPHRPRSLLF